MPGLNTWSIIHSECNARHTMEWSKPCLNGCVGYLPQHPLMRGIAPPPSSKQKKKMKNIHLKCFYFPFWNYTKIIFNFISYFHIFISPTNEILFSIFFSPFPVWLQLFPFPVWLSSCCSVKTKQHFSVFQEQWKEKHYHSEAPFPVQPQNTSKNIWPKSLLWRRFCFRIPNYSRFLFGNPLSMRI